LQWWTTPRRTGEQEKLIEQQERYVRAALCGAGTEQEQVTGQRIFGKDNCMKTSLRATLVCLAVAVAVTALLAPAMFAGKPDGDQSGTTLAAYKTIDICELRAPGTIDGDDPGLWRYSGEIALWNEGAVDTVGLEITDVIEYKVGNKPWKTAYVTLTIAPDDAGDTLVIPAGTTMETAITIPYSYDGAPLEGTIRNKATITILNHSGSLGKPKGPEPKATWFGPIEPCGGCNPDACTYTQGYWGNKPGVVWPEGYSRDAWFWYDDLTGEGQTWQQVLDAPTGGSGYYILAHQYIAAVLNKANGVCVPKGVQDTINLADAWFDTNGPSACDCKGSCCGLQKDWGEVLDDFNNGIYPGGPVHCGDE
jgi:hypothetical protein